MNGGKDFSEWSRRDDLLYQTIRVPVEAILGRDGVGLPDCAIAESKFEKARHHRPYAGPDAPIGEIQRDGTPDIEFAAVGLLARSQLAAGHSQDARRTLESLRQRFAESGQSRFLPNIDAMLCRVDLRTGDTDAVDSWYREKAPRDPLSINIMKRYQYFTQAMAELAQGRPQAALLTPGSAGTLLHRLPAEDGSHHPAAFAGRGPVPAKDEAWRQSLTDALRIAAGLGFIRPVAAAAPPCCPCCRPCPARRKRAGTGRWWPLPGCRPPGIPTFWCRPCPPARK